MIRRLWCRVFGHGSGKNVHSSSYRLRKEQVLEAVDGVGQDDPDVLGTLRDEQPYELGERRLVDLERHDVDLRSLPGHGHQRLAGTRADLDDQRRRPAEDAFEVQRCTGGNRGAQLVPLNLEQEPVPVRGPRDALSRPHPGTAPDERDQVPVLGRPAGLSHAADRTRLAGVV